MYFALQELRFIIVSVPIFNLSAAVAASRMYVASSLREYSLFFYQQEYFLFSGYIRLDIVERILLCFAWMEGADPEGFVFFLQICCVNSGITFHDIKGIFDFFVLIKGFRI